MVETLNEVVDSEIEALPEDMRARLTHIAKLIEEKGPARLTSSMWKAACGRCG